MTANVKAIRLFDPATWWGDASDIGRGRIAVGETPVVAAKTIDIYGVEANRHELGYLSNGRFKTVGEYRLVLDNVPWGSGSEELPRTVRNYEPLQNATLFEMVNPLTDYAQLEGVGMVGTHGQVTFVQFRLPEFVVGGRHEELHKQFLVFGDDKTFGGFKVGNTRTRVVCENTWMAATGNIEPLPHTADLRVLLRYAVTAYHETLAQAEQEHTMLNAMFARRLNKGELNTGIKRVVPTPKFSKNLRNLAVLLRFDPEKLTEGDVPVLTDDEEVQGLVEKEVSRYQGDVDRVDARRSAIADAFFAFNDQHPHAADTAYAFFNAVTYVASHGQDIVKGNGKPLFYNDDAGLSLLWGERAKLNDRAWAYANSLTK